VTSSGAGDGYIACRQMVTVAAPALTAIDRDLRQLCLLISRR
jgi:hypothetical protein